MKKILLIMIILALTFGRAFSQSPTLSISGPTDWTPGTSITLSVDLTFTGFNAPAVSYWLEVNNALAPFLTITNLSHFTFPLGNTVGLPGIIFHQGDNGFATENVDLGGSVKNPATDSVPPGSYHITDITFSLTSGAPAGMYTLRTSTTSPHASEVSDTDFNDHNIPESDFVFNVVPEPGTFALIGLGIAGGSLFINRRRK
jgi:hypothetical protein